MDTEILHQFRTLVILLNREGNITFANQAFIEKSGYTEQELINQDAKNFIKDLNSLILNKSGNTYIQAKNGDEIPYWLEISQFKHSSQTGLVFSDIKMSGLDPLTKLPNRYLFTRHLKKAINKAKTTQDFFAVFFIDLDRFKFINDTLGHTYGDLLLIEVAQRLKKAAGLGNIVARMGGDEFVYLAQDLADVDAADGRADRMIAAFQEPFHLKETELYISPSIGVSLYPYDGDDIETLLINADSAMYRAKRSGRSKMEKAKVEITAGSFEKLMIETSLRKAMEKEELQLFYQPQMDLQQKAIVGMEALLRWKHPEFGNIPPAEFIPIAEDSGLILPIGDWVIKTACLKIKEWLAAGHPNVKVAVNLSAKQFLQNDLADKIKKAIADTGIPATCLELEITESMMMYDIESAANVLNNLKKLGIHITIDDFGKGYSSLQYLQRLPLDTLKIDRSFIFDIHKNPSSKALAHAISDMAHALKMQVIAEGVETTAQLLQVESLKCDVVQGFYYSKPLCPEDADQFLLANGRQMSVV